MTLTEMTQRALFMMDPIQLFSATLFTNSTWFPWLDVQVPLLDYRHGTWRSMFDKARACVGGGSRRVTARLSYRACALTLAKCKFEIVRACSRR